MLKTTLIEFKEYLQVLVNMIKKDGVSSNKCKSIRKTEYEIVKICLNLDLKIYLDSKKFKLLVQ